MLNFDCLDFLCKNSRIIVQSKLYHVITNNYRLLTFRYLGPKETKLPPGIRFIRAIAIPLILAAIYMEYTIDYQREKAAARLSRVTP